ncbi:MAG: hypothetical protein ACFFCS_18570 [Candidatus Hodarchaeota archaeon]
MSINSDGEDDAPEPESSDDEIGIFKNEHLELEDDTADRSPRLPVFSTGPKYMWIPIVLCIIFAGLLALLLQFGGLDVSYAPVDEEKYGFLGTLINALIFIGIGAVSAFFMIILIRKKGINVIEKVMIVAFLIIGIMFIYVFGFYAIGLFIGLLNVTINVLAGVIIEYTWFAIAIILGLLLAYIYTSNKFGDNARNLAVLIYGVLIGSYLPLILPTWTAILILIGFSLYDIYSVKKGPIKEMMGHMGYEEEEGEGEDDPVDLSDITLDIGIGDLAFYSTLTSMTLVSNDFGGPHLVTVTGNPLAYIFPFILTITGVLIGAYISFEYVKKSKILPGLPMSIFIGLGLLTLSIFLGVLIF